MFLAAEAGRLAVAAVAHGPNLFGDWAKFWNAIYEHLGNTLWYGLQAADMFLFGMTPAFFVLRLKRPRPSLRVILRNSGTAAVLAIVFGLFWVTGFLLLWFPETFRSETAISIATGGTVAVVWGAMALGRKWVAEPSVADRVGRLLGIIAIGTALVATVVFRI